LTLKARLSLMRSATSPCGRRRRPTIGRHEALGAARREAVIQLRVAYGANPANRFQHKNARLFKDKLGGLVVDYLGLADELRKALATYTEAGGTGKTALDQAEAVAVMLAKYEVCVALFHGFSWSHWLTGTPGQKLTLLPAAQEHILAQEDGQNRLLRGVTELSQAFALAVPHDEALRIRDDVGFFQAV
jgi:type I site-specific restriction-modification system R (restriction) subunit